MIRNHEKGNGAAPLRSAVRAWEFRLASTVRASPLAAESDSDRRAGPGRARLPRFVGRPLKTYRKMSPAGPSDPVFGL
jgi:hypothetical protein